MKRRDLENHLRSCRCVLHHHGARHDMWLNPTNERTAPVPRHKEIKRGIVRSVCRMLGIAEPSNP